MGTPRSSVFLLLTCCALVLGAAGASCASGEPDFAAAAARSRAVADELKSYHIEADVQVASGMTGMEPAMSFAMQARAAGVWPDRMLNAHEGDAFTLNSGSGPAGEWLYIGQRSTCYQGPAGGLVRDLDGAATFELTRESVYNFYAGLAPFVLSGEPAATAEVGHETLTVAGREVPCLVFTLAAEAAAPTEGAPVRGEAKSWYDPASGLVLKAVEVTLGMQNGMGVTQTVTTTVTSYSVDEPVADDVFAFTPPSGTRVVPAMELLLNPDALTGQAAPALAYKGLDGVAGAVADHRGKVVFLNFWATWCPPCRQEMPHIQTLYAEMADRDDVVFLLASSEDAATVQGFLAKNPQYTFPVVLAAQGDVAGPWKTTSIPSIFVIGKDGTIRAHLVGGQTEQGMRRALAKAGIGD